jgi:hypothetical protein
MVNNSLTFDAMIAKHPHGIDALDFCATRRKRVPPTQEVTSHLAPGSQQAVSRKRTATSPESEGLAALQPNKPQKTNKNKKMRPAECSGKPGMPNRVGGSSQREPTFREANQIWGHQGVSLVNYQLYHTNMNSGGQGSREFERQSESQGQEPGNIIWGHEGESWVNHQSYHTNMNSGGQGPSEYERQSESQGQEQARGAEHTTCLQLNQDSDNDSDNSSGLYNFKHTNGDHSDGDDRTMSTQDQLYDSTFIS